MLKVAAAAMRDAGFGLRENRPDMGAVIGIDFDFEAANFHLRWQLPNVIDQWAEKLGWNPQQSEKHKWLESLQGRLQPAAYRKPHLRRFRRHCRQPDRPGISLWQPEFRGVL